MSRRDRRAAAKKLSKAKGSRVPNGAVVAAEIATSFDAALKAHRRGDLAEAEMLYRSAIDAAPGAGEAAYVNLGVVLKARGAFEEAEHCFNRALKVNPESPATLNNLGNLFRGTGRPEAAIEILNRCIRYDEGNFDAYVNLALSYADLRRLGDAVDMCRRAGEIAPKNVRVHTILGSCLRMQGRPDAALNAFRRALSCRPGDPRAHGGLGRVFWDQGRLADAIATYRTALALEPDMPDIFSSMLFALCFDERLSPEALTDEHRRYGAAFSAPLVSGSISHADADFPDRRLRVGYVSPDFRRHPGGHFLMPHVMYHDRAACEVFCYHIGHASDDLTDMFRSHSEGWRSAEMLAGENLAERIREDRIDILVECTGHMADNRLSTFSTKPAPIQVSFPLYPATTGVPEIDYRISDRLFGPPWADELHTEALVRMPDAHVCYQPRPDSVPPAPLPPSVANGHVTFGCFNNIAKFGVSTLDALAMVLRATPGSRLHLGWRGVEGASGNLLRERFASRGVAAGRLSIVGWQHDPLSRYLDVDICLDTLFANGGTTTCDALWMGVPVVTCYGETPFSRVGLCHLTTVGLPELIAADVAGYVRLAGELAGNARYLASLRRNLRGRVAASPLFDAPRYARHLDAAFREMWRRRCRGLEPESFDVADHLPGHA